MGTREYKKGFVWRCEVYVNEYLTGIVYWCALHILIAMILANRYLEIREDNELENESWSYFVPYKSLSDKLISKLNKVLDESGYFSLFFF